MSSQNLPFSRKSIREVLRSWDNLQKLGEHPLTHLKIVEKRHQARNRADTPPERGLSLRDVLRAAIEEQRVGVGDPDYSDKRWRPYVILKEEFIAGRDPDYLAVQLDDMAPRTYQRARSQAIDKLAAVLQQWEDEARDVPSKEARPGPFLAPPKPPYRLVGRYSFLQDLKGQLLAGGSVALCALNGLPGVGKTALAIELAHDDEVLAHFQDGVLWAGLGQEPDVPLLLGQWAAALGIPSGEIARLPTVADRANAVHAAIGMRRMLLIVDDVWQLETALAFRLGGPNCAHLLTTRLPGLAQDFAEGRAMTVHELSNAGGLLLLGQLAPSVAEAEPDEAQELVRAVGGLPLAILLIARYVRRGVGAESRPLQAALKQLQATEERLRIAHPQPPVGSHPSLPAGTPLSLLASIEISDKTLGDAARRTFYTLSVLPPKPNTFSREAALAVAAEPARALDTLVESGLLESSEPGRYTLHQAIADYARLRRTEEEAYRRMVAYFVNYVEAHENDHDLLALEMNNILAALQAAFDREMQAEGVRGVNALARCLEARGLYSLAEVHLNRAREAARSLNDGAGLAMALLNLGRIEQRRGEYAQAEEYFREGLALARPGGDLAVVSLLTANLGWLTMSCGKYIKAEEYFQEALSLARESGNPEGISILLGNLGVIADYLGEFAKAEEYYQESLALARQIGYRERMSDLLIDLGVLASQCGKFTEAEEYYQESSALAQAIGHRENLCWLLAKMGELAYHRGDDAQAEELYQESLTLARELGQREIVIELLRHLGVLAVRCGHYTQAQEFYQEGLALARKMKRLADISALLYAWGDFYLEQQELDSAFAAFVEALEIAREIHAQVQIADALYGLARVEAARGRIAEARRYGEESLAIFEAMGHHKKAEVREWLAALSWADPSD